MLEFCVAAGLKICFSKTAPDSRNILEVKSAATSELEKKLIIIANKANAHLNVR